ncbi:multicopper oxidase domain-containing protein [Roseibium sp.]|uniref:multicopper oxidase domain-containing protein n=1 Tax=Roseibium sp. TaxID=1936156 RepID=UPI003A984C64
MIKRRNLLVGGAAAVLTAGAVTWIGRQPGSTNAASLASRPRLNYPPLLDATRNSEFKLGAQYGSHAFGTSVRSSTAGFNQPYLGPTILFTNGETRARVGNTLNEDITVHWHGLIVPGDQDGGPHQPIPSGEEWSVNLEVDQPPSTLWYHSHSHRRTAVQVYRGLAGMMILTDGQDEERGLPNSYGIDDLAIVIQDRRFDSSGKLSYDLGMMDLMHGFTGETITVNGQVDAVAVVPKGVARLRVLNGSNARIFNLFVDDGRPLHLVGTDGGLLEKPVALSELSLSPGERAELLVDFSDGTPITLYSDPDPNQGPGGMMGRFQGAFSKLFGDPYPVLSIAVDERNIGRIQKVPDVIGGQPAKSAERLNLSRSFALNMGMGMGMMGGGPSFGINDRPFDLGRIDLTIPLGSTETWTVRSDMLNHPFHVHGTQFEVISENGGAPRPEYAGLKDTVLVTGSVELKMHFARPASADTPFMYHCHILEHEDSGMMGQFVVA